VTSRKRYFTGRDERTYRTFRSMIRRAKDYGLNCEFKLGKEGYDKFANIIGPIPSEMLKPTVGRYDHSLGYVFDNEARRWNFRWQEFNENAKESAPRAGKAGGSKKSKRKTEAARAGGKATAALGKTQWQTMLIEKRRAYGKKGGLAMIARSDHTMKKQGACEHCGAVMSIALLGKYHNNRCPKKPASRKS
jgi:hypothetical protein